MRWFRRKTFETKESAVMVVAGGRYESAASPDTRYDKLAKESYMENVIAFRCIDLVAKAVASVDWQVMQQDSKGEETIAPNHPLAPLLSRPNPTEGFAAFIEKVMAYHMIGGDSFIERIRVTAGMRAGVTRELYAHRPDRITIKHKGLEVTGYKYQDDSVSYEWDVDPVTGQSDLLHLKSFNPLDDFYGWGIAMSAAGEIDSSNAANKWNRTSFTNGCRPGMIMTFKSKLAPEQYARLKQQVEQKYSGADNAGKTMILEGVSEKDGDVAITPYGWTPKEMDFTESENKMARRIAFAYGVPPQLVGIPGDNTYANYKEARESFWEDTVTWYLQLLQSELNNWLLPDDKFYLMPMLDDSPAMEAKKNKNLEMAQKCDFLTINEKRMLAGFPPITGGDVMLAGMGMMPLLGEDVGDYDSPSEDDLADEEDKARRELMRIVGDEKIAASLMQGDYND